MLKWKVLSNIVKNNKIKTITVDVFDTLLMRKTYPEDLQFIEHARLAVKLLEQPLKRKINPLLFYSLRKDIREINDEVQEKRKQDRETRIEDLFSLIIETLSQKYSVTLSPQKKEELVEQIIKKELKTEEKHLKLNKELIEWLRKMKEQGKRIYFLSDIYLSGNHIKRLFKHFKVETLFAGGFSSADISFGKGTGKMFAKIKSQQLIPQFEYFSTLHIGDNRISDHISPAKYGMLTYHYQTMHHRVIRPLKTFWGKLLLDHKLRKHDKITKKKLKKQLTARLKQLSQTEQELYSVGWAMGPALIHYLNSLNLFCHIQQTPIYFLSREGIMLERYLKKLGSQQVCHTLTSFNRLNALRCFAYLSLTKPLVKYSEAIVQLFYHGENKRTLEDLLDSMGLEKAEFGLTKLALHQMPAEKFIKRLIKVTGQQDHPKLKSAFSKMVTELNKTELLNYKNVTLADVGWSGTIQILLEQILTLLKKDIKTQGIYLGTTGHNIFGLEKVKNMKGILFQTIQEPFFHTSMIEEIWEYVLTANGENDEKLTSIQKGVKDMIDFYKNHIECSPEKLFNLSKKALKKLFYYPTRKQILLLGSIQHDIGFGSKKKRPLVETKYSYRYLYYTLLRHNGHFKWIYSQQYWQRGFLKWYRMTFLLPLINALRWLTKKNLEIFK